MKKAQKKKVKSIIENGCLLMSEFTHLINNNHYDRCVVGELLSAVGVTDEELEEMNGNSISDYRLVSWMPKLKAEFGITFDQLVRLEKENDRHKSTPTRRLRLAETVDSFPTED